jgi:hypothetical protein
MNKCDNYILLCTAIVLYCRYMIMHGRLGLILKNKYSLRSVNYRNPVRI